jgi:hypothetical protein
MAYNTRRILERVELAADAIQRGVIAEINGHQRAALDCAQLLGRDCGIAFDSAESLYRAALEKLGVRHGGVCATGLRDLYLFALQHRRGVSGGSSTAPRIAMDAAAAKSFAERHPAAAAINIGVGCAPGRGAI